MISNEVNIQKREKLLIFLGMLIVGLILYIGFLSINYDGNGLIDLDATDQGGAALFTPNHMLYRSMILITYRLMQLVGYSGLTMLAAQLLTAVSSALGLALYYLWVSRFVRSRTIAILATLGFGISWTYWYFSTDAFYITPASTSVIGALVLLGWVFDRPANEIPRWLIIGMGVLTSLGILIWQGNVFFIPMALLGLFLRSRSNTRQFLISSLIFLVTTGLIVGLTFFILSLYILGSEWSISNFIDYLLSYGGAPLEIWGKWDIERVIPASNSMVASLIPVWVGLGLRDLLRGQISLEKLPLQFSLVALILLLAVPMIQLIRHRSLTPFTRNLILILLIGYFCYVPFIVWWDPFEPKWFLFPNIALWIIIGVLWETIAIRDAYKWAFGVLVAIIAYANFSSTIWPNHALPNVLMNRAECIANNMSEHDVLIVTEMGWPSYMNYFFSRQVFSLLDAVPRLGSTESTLNLIDTSIDQINQQGGKLLITDSDSLSVDHFNWLNGLIGVNKDDLERLETSPAFSCDTINYDVVTGVLPDTAN